MTHADDPIDFKALRIDPAKFEAPPTPAKIRKRRKQFVIVPMLWKEKLREKPPASSATYDVALYLLYSHWKGGGKPFKLANGMLKYDGIGRSAKWRALVDLERRGLIIIERRSRKSPIIHVLLMEI